MNGAVSRLAVCLVAFVAAGCGGEDEGPTGEVEGTVTLANKPLADANIQLVNPDTGAPFGGKITDGKFKLEDPVPVGTYKVAITPPEAPQPDDEASGKKATQLAKAIPLGYQDTNSSGLTAKVEEGPNKFEFKLLKKGPPRTADNAIPP